MAVATYRNGVSRFAIGLALITAAPAFAQEAAVADDAAANDEIIVTGVAKGQNRLDSSISVSSLNADAIAIASPRSAAELFRSIPGIRSESSGGEGNANIQMRGIPISTGGAKFLQHQILNLRNRPGLHLNRPALAGFHIHQPLAGEDDHALVEIEVGIQVGLKARQDPFTIDEFSVSIGNKGLSAFSWGEAGQFG